MDRSEEFWGRYSGRAERQHPDRCLDWCPICRGADFLRDALSPELQEQLQALQREAIAALQAAVAAHLERLREEEGRDEGPPDVSSIPID